MITRPFMLDDRGSASIQTMAIIFFMSALCLGTFQVLNQSSLAVRRQRERARAERSMSLAIANAVNRLSENPTIEADSSLDPAYTGSSYEGVSVEIQELSSRLNPNWVSMQLLDDTALKSMLLPGKSTAELAEFRRHDGLEPTIDDYATFFTPIALKNELSIYSYANINTTDALSLKRLYYEAIGDAVGAEFFYQKIIAQKQNMGLITESELNVLLGIQGDSLKSLITTRAQCNVNFASFSLIKSILGYPTLNIEGSESIANAITSIRQSQEINEKGLRSLLGNLDQSNAVFSYLGVRSWFWSVKASLNGRSTVAIVARGLPCDEQSSVMKLKIVEVYNEKKQ